MSESDPGKVSVIVPARNEEANIERVLRSLAGQQSVREILVVDDNSSDRTAEIARALKEEIPTLRTLRVDSLPEGWLGKNYAVALGAREAAGDWLLFTDADTEHLPGSLAATLEIAEREGADLLSLSPGQITPTWWEKAVIPLVYVNLARLYKFEDVSNPASPAAAANGQYLLIRRAVYERIGGHEAIRNQVLEDVELAKRVKATGGKLIFLPGAEWVRTRMYSTFGEMWAGWSKNLYLLYGRSLWRILKTLANSVPRTCCRRFSSSCSSCGYYPVKEALSSWSGCWRVWSLPWSGTHATCGLSLIWDSTREWRRGGWRARQSSACY